MRRLNTYTWCILRTSSSPLRVCRAKIESCDTTRKRFSLNDDFSRSCHRVLSEYIKIERNGEAFDGPAQRIPRSRTSKDIRKSRMPYNFYAVIFTYKAWCICTATIGALTGQSGSILQCSFTVSTPFPQNFLGQTFTLQ
jgi:hypothetical protein